MLAPEGRLAAILTGRERVLVSEELVLRARADVDAGRTRHAALQLLVALDAAIAELSAEPAGPDLDARLDALRAHREPVGAAAQAALAGELDGAQVDATVDALQRVEAALRARTAARS
jgi:hypothetical protein